MNRAIIMLTLSGRIGGVERRYINLFRYLSRIKKTEYHLVINYNLYKKFINELEGLSNIHVLNFDRIYRVPEIKKPTDTNFAKNKYNRPYWINFLGRTKYVIKLIFSWIQFSCLLIPIFFKYKFKTVYGVWTGGIWTWIYKYIFKFRFCYAFMDSNYDSLDKAFHKFFDSEYWVLRNADLVDCLSPKIAEDLKNRIRFRKKTQICVTPNSFIDYTNYYPAEKKENALVFLSRLYPKKNPMLLLKAVNILKENDEIPEDFEVKILGEGPEEICLNNYIEEKELKCIKLLGLEDKPWKHLQKSKVFVSLQENDNYPSQSLIEAMACENAIIATDVGNTQLLVSDNEGILINKDAEELANAISLLFQNNSLLEKLGKNARNKVITTHTINNFSDHFLKITSNDKTP